MVIIDLMTSLMGVRMGFLAFMLIGGMTGASTWIFYPGRFGGVRPGKLLAAALVGILAALASSYIGQLMDFFQSGQMLEWLTAILAACLAGIVFTALAK